MTATWISLILWTDKYQRSYAIVQSNTNELQTMLLLFSNLKTQLVDFIKKGIKSPKKNTDPRLSRDLQSVQGWFKQKLDEFPPEMDLIKNLMNYFVLKWINYQWILSRNRFNIDEFYLKSIYYRWISLKIRFVIDEFHSKIDLLSMNFIQRSS